MGVNAIAEAHAAGVPAWVSEGGRIWRLEPDGTRHLEERSGDEVLAAMTGAAVAEALAVLDLVPDVPPDPGDALPSP